MVRGVALDTELLPKVKGVRSSTTNFDQRYIGLRDSVNDLFFLSDSANYLFPYVMRECVKT